jgi:sec-independent protein translocase protein TatA
MNIIASLFNLAGPDLIVILLICLLLFGSKKLPELARGMGEAFKEFHKAKDEIERELTRADVNIQPAPGQQPRQVAELPATPPAPVMQTAQAIPVAPVAVAPAPVAPAPVAYVPVAEPVAHVAPSAEVVSEPIERHYPAGQV